ncbi:MAG: DnaJ C-terminal domain-containing protein, partial [Hyphomonas sp.]|uniref:DnaJ C-terminal domain-containing protein n=1 Tax=Hyphomonas sp. TaxID=87 RepID=UPI0034A03972
HPDQNPEDPKAKERFAEANQAYEILGEEEKRKAFDRGEIDATGKPRFQDFGGAGGAGFRQQRGGPGASHFEFRTGGFEAGDIFSEIFGDAFSQGADPGTHFRQQRGPGAGAGAPPPPDLNATLEVSIEEVVTAAKVTAQFPDGRKIAVKLPAYVEDGQTIRLKGQGQPSPFTGARGDALVRIRFASHPNYRVEGRDLHTDVPVDLADAVLGGKVTVETPTGKVSLGVPAWSSSGRAMRLKGRGLPLKTGGHGNLYAHVQVMLPADDAELEALMKKRRG